MASTVLPTAAMKVHWGLVLVMLIWSSMDGVLGLDKYVSLFNPGFVHLGGETLCDELNLNVYIVSPSQSLLRTRGRLGFTAAKKVRRMLLALTAQPTLGQIPFRCSRSNGDGPVFCCPWGAFLSCPSAAPSQCLPQQHSHAVPQLPFMLCSSAAPSCCPSAAPSHCHSGVLSRCHSEAFPCCLTAAFSGSSPSAAAHPCCSPTATPGFLPAAFHYCPSKASCIPLLSACSIPHINRAGLN